MRRAPTLALLLLALRVSGAAAEPEKPKSQPKNHGNALSGTVMRVEAAAKAFTVRSANGKETRLVWTDATRIRGEGLRVGDRVAVRWLERDGKKIATSIRVEPPAVAATTPSAPGTR